MFYFLNTLTFILNCFFIEKYLHIYQCRDYNFLRYLKYFSKKGNILMFFACFFVVFQLFFNFFLFNFAINIILLILNIFYISSLTHNNKTPIKYTGKIKRLYIISIIFNIFFMIFKFYTPFSIVLLLFCPIISNFLNFYDKIKNKKLIKEAQKKLKNSNAKIIAITGSNGKTSVKNILYELLKTQFKVLKTPASYNTPLGISKFINESDLSYCDFIILEYGARRVGDIKKLCNLYGADYGILTTISEQHLESFKTIENIVKAKNELPVFLKDKLCVYNSDNTFTQKLYNEKCGKKVSVSISKKAKVYTSNIKTENGKTEFVVHIKKHKINASTILLGKHNILNILLCVALATELGVKPKLLQNSIQNLKAIPHRLELIKTHINILDDTYNCSLASATEAIEVLKSFNSKSMIATPGIIEGGKEEQNINFKLGQLCSVADYIIIIGEHNKQSLLQGIQSKNFNKKNILFAKTLEQAKQYFSLLPTSGTLLLLNDLPDDYN